MPQKLLFSIKTILSNGYKKLDHRVIENTLFLDPVPSLMRGDSFQEKKLMGDCSNLSGVLFGLWQKEETRPIIIEFIRSLPEQDVTDIEFFQDRRGKISLELVETFGGQERKWSVELLSDGTLRVLAIAAALLSAPEGATVVIEEVDNGVHPSRAKQLLKTMREQATKRNIRLLFSTHNPALMDALPDEALSDVVFCYRDPVEGDSRLVRLSDIQDYAGLVSQGPLGDLVTNGVIDTSVFLNILNVPGCNNETEKVTESFREDIELECTFILPMATILETGNHIAQRVTTYKKYH